MDEEYSYYIKRMLKNFSCALLFCAFVFKLFTVFEYAHLHVAMVLIWGAFIFLALYLYFEKQITLSNTSLYLTIIGFLIVSAISWQKAVDTNAATDVLLMWFTNIIFFLCVAYWAKDHRIWHIIVGLFLGCIAVEFAYGFYQYFVDLPALRMEVKESPELLNTVKTSLNRIGMFNARLQNEQIFAHFTLPNSYGVYIALAIPIIFALFVHSLYLKNRVYTVCVGIFFVSALANLLLTKSRGSILSLLIIVLAFFSVYVRKKMQEKHFLYLLIAVLIVSASLCFLMSTTNTLNFIGENSTSFLIRSEYWKSSASIWTESPLLGVGIGNFPVHFYAHKPIWLEEVNNAHNFYIQFAVEAGLLGIAILGIFLLLLWKRLRYCQVNTTIPDNEIPLYRLTIPISLMLSCALLYITAAFAIDTSDMDYLQKVWNLDISTQAIEVLFFIIVIALFIASIRFTLKTELRSILQTPLFLAVCIFLLHTAIDIDFYVHNLNLIFWLLLGLYISQTKSTMKTPLVFPKKLFMLFIVMICVLIIYILNTTAANKLQQHQQLEKTSILAENLAKSQNQKDYNSNLQEYYQHLEETIKIQPHNPDYRIRLGILILQNINESLQKQRVKKTNVEEINKIMSFIKIAENHIEEAIANNKHLKIKFLNPIAQFYLLEADIWKTLNARSSHKKSLEKALFFAEKALQQYPFSSMLSYLCAIICEEMHDEKKTLEYYQQTLQISDSVYPAAYGIEKEKRDKIYQKIYKLLKY